MTLYIRQDADILQAGTEKVFPVSLRWSAAILTMSSLLFLLVPLTPFSCSHFLNIGTFTLEICTCTRTPRQTSTWYQLECMYCTDEAWPITTTVCRCILFGICHIISLIMNIKITVKSRVNIIAIVYHADVHLAHNVFTDTLNLYRHLLATLALYVHVHEWLVEIHCLLYNYIPWPSYNVYSWAALHGIYM